MLCKHIVQKGFVTLVLALPLGLAAVPFAVAQSDDAALYYRQQSPVSQNTMQYRVIQNRGSMAATASRMAPRQGNVQNIPRNTLNRVQPSYNYANTNATQYRLSAPVAVPKVTYAAPRVNTLHSIIVTQPKVIPNYRTAPAVKPALKNVPSFATTRSGVNVKPSFKTQRATTASVSRKGRAAPSMKTGMQPPAFTTSLAGKPQIKAPLVKTRGKYNTQTVNNVVSTEKASRTVVPVAAFPAIAPPAVTPALKTALLQKPAVKRPNVAIMPAQKMRKAAEVKVLPKTLVPAKKVVHASPSAALKKTIHPRVPLVAKRNSKLPRSKRSKQVAGRMIPILQQQMADKGLLFGNQIYLRVFKQESIAELWVEKEDGTYALFKEYPICRFGGREFGPKIKEGDKQSPEGFYAVTPGRMNPYSDRHLSFDIGFPNAYDRQHGRTGSNLMVHGGCTSVGCFAMTDAGIEEIYVLAEAALDHSGAGHFNVHIFPFRMTNQSLVPYYNSPWFSFWFNLKEGYDFFEKHRTPPTVHVTNKEYAFSFPLDGKSTIQTQQVASAAAE